MFPSTDLASVAWQPRVTWVKPSGQPLPGPREWEVAALILDELPGSWESLQVSRNGAALQVTQRHLAGQIQVVVEWPRAGPGQYWLTFSCAGHVATLSCLVEALKLLPGGVESLLADLYEQLPADVALSLQQAGGLAGIAPAALKPATPEEELARLKRALYGTADRPGLINSLRAVAQRPHQVLEAYRLPVRRELLKRPRPAALVRAITQSANHPDHERAVKLPDERVAAHVDIYENHVVKAAVLMVRQRLLALARVATQRKELGQPVADLRADFEWAVSSAPFLTEVSALRGPPVHLTMVLVKRDEYRAALETLLDLQRALEIRLDDERLLHPLQNLPALYQLWCSLHVILALTDACKAAGFALVEERLTSTYPGTVLLKVLPNGQPLLRFERPADGSRVTMTSERTFRRQGSAFRSVSFEQRPDLVIEVQRENGLAELWILDPKYKLDSENDPVSGEAHQPDPAGRPKKTDIDKMHAYRDAIRSPAGAQAVRFAGILYPGPDCSYSPGLGAISARPLHAGALRASLRALFETQEVLTPTPHHDPDTEAS
ncbi:nuclease domain-containing protein [Deinococcus detaillensis]|uniref:nuclease domain-containing protein n=1 Tax=Deinococcus detaillensis TaxID=2592048 RepID=UPI00163DA666|nr:DUF2357 domain-containing protein [Deinococcus detaillensis]